MSARTARQRCTCPPGAQAGAGSARPALGVTALSGEEVLHKAHSLSETQVGGQQPLRLPGTTAQALGALLRQVCAVARGAAAAQRAAAAGEGAASAQQP